jgi:asparagine synthase (glutamine-hydrolysing)
MGFKPFYYCHKPSRLFAFGTEIKALLEYPQVPQAINDARIADYLNRWGGDPETTFFKAIRRLPPAHRLIVQRGQVSIQRYWALDRHRELSYASDADYVEGFREVFAEAVRCRLQSPRKAGVMLSGGLDSSSVACVAHGLPESSSPLSTFSAVFPGLPCSEQAMCDERPYLDALQAQGGYDQHRISLSEASPLAGIDRALDRLDQPLYINNVYLYNRLHQAGQRQGIGVLLDGAEGDDAVSYGFGYLSELAFRRDWISFGCVAKELAHRMDVSAVSMLGRYGTRALQKQARDGRWIALARDAYTVAEQFGRSYADVLWNDAVKPTLREPLRRIWHGLKGRRSTRSTSHTLASRDLMHRTDFQRRRKRYENQFALEAFTAREAHWHTLHGGAGDIATILEEVDGMAAMHGIEQRHPFYDVRVLSYCLALPAEQQLRHGWSRSILRRAMRGQLPEAIRTRTDKADLSLNFRRNLARFEDRHLRRLVDDAPRSWNDYVDADAVRRAYAQGRLIDLWPALVLSRWLQQQADRTRARRKRIDFKSHAGALA